jgi:DNA recombination protein RmuC
MDYFALIILILTGGVLFLIYKISQQGQINLQQAKDIQEIKEKLLLGTQIQDHLKNGIEKTRDLLEDLKIAEQVRKEKEAEFSERIKRMDEIIAGTSAKGLSGEEILRETFKKLPPEMIETNFTVEGKKVEFALILPNNKRLPIDSKWPASDLLLELEKETSPQKRKAIIKAIEKETIRRIKEVRQYVDPSITWSQAIAAIPDSVYAVCREAHLKASENDVILMPYSMVLPLILYMYRLHLQYAISLDIENLQNHLISISRNLDEMENVLENKIYRGTTMVSNAYSEYKQMISKIRASLNELQLRRPEENKKLEEK